MTYWSHPIVFDVNDFFDLDYNLLLSVRMNYNFEQTFLIKGDK